MKTQNLMIALLFVLSPLAAMGVEAQPLVPVCEDGTPVVDACLPVAVPPEGGIGANEEACGPAGGDPLYDVLCATAVGAGFAPGPDQDGDGRADFYSMVVTPPVGPAQTVRVQTDFFYTPPGQTGAIDDIVAAWGAGDGWFDVMATRVMLYNGANLVTPSGEHSPHRFTNHYLVDNPTGSPTAETVHFGLYRPSEDGFGLCTVCLKPSENRLGFKVGPAYDPDGYLTPQAGNAGAFSLDVDTFVTDASSGLAKLEHSILDNSMDTAHPENTPTWMLLRFGDSLFKNHGTADLRGRGTQWPDGQPADTSTLHIKYFQDVGTLVPEPHLYLTKYSNLDDDASTDFEELFCPPNQPTNPFNPLAHCADWDGDGLSNEADNDPTRPIKLVELVGQPVGPAPLAGFSFTYFCYDVAGDEGITFAGPRIVGQAAETLFQFDDCADAPIEPVPGVEPRRSGTFTVPADVELKNALGTDVAHTYSITASYNGMLQTDTAVATVLGNGVQTGALTLTVEERLDGDNVPVADTTGSATADGSAVTLTAQDYTEADAEAHKFVVTLTWVPSSPEAQGQTTTAVKFGTATLSSPTWNFNTAVVPVIDSDGSDGFTAEFELLPSQAGHSLHFMVETADTGGRDATAGTTSASASRINFVVPKVIHPNEEPTMDVKDLEQGAVGGLNEVGFSLRVDYTDRYAAGHRHGSTGEAPTQVPTLHYRPGTMSGGTFVPAAGASDYLELPLGRVDGTAGECRDYGGTTGDVNAAQDAIERPGCEPFNSQFVNGNFADGEAYSVSFRTTWTLDNTHLEYYVSAADAASDVESTPVAVEVDTTAPALVSSGAVSVPDPYRIVTNPDCGFPYDDKDACGSLAEVDTTLVDRIDPHDTNGNGNRQESNGQIDLVEQFVFYWNVDEGTPDPNDDLSGDAGSTLHVWQNRGFQQPTAKQMSVRIGDVAGTSDVEVLVIESEEDDVYCVITSDGRNVLHARSGGWNHEDGCGPRVTVWPTVNQAADWTGEVVWAWFYAECLNLLPGAPNDCPPLLQIVDEDRDNVPETVILGLPSVDCILLSLDASCPTDMHEYTPISLDSPPEPDPNELCDDGVFPDCLLGDDPTGPVMGLVEAIECMINGCEDPDPCDPETEECDECDPTADPTCVAPCDPADPDCNPAAVPPCSEAGDDAVFCAGGPPGGPSLLQALGVPGWDGLTIRVPVLGYVFYL